jgi:membrane associated rhomboid family serine protease
MELYLTQAPVACFIFAITIITTLIAFSNDLIFDKLILHPYYISRGKNVYTLITSGLIHADYGHLFFNMLSFYFFAFNLEPVLGHWQFTLLYVLSLVLSDLPSVSKHKDDIWYRSLGASGAISAVIFSFILYNPFAPLGLIFIPGINIYAVIFGVLYLVYCSYASKRGQGNVNHDAHFFGALSGIMITIILHHEVLSQFIQTITEKVQSFGH